MDVQVDEETGRFVFESVKVLPQSLYDPLRAQTAHHIKWILNCAYPEGLPDYFGTPFYIGKDSRLVLSPHVISGLVSGHVYQLACGSIFPDSDSDSWSGSHSGVLTQLASKWSLYPMEQASTASQSEPGNALGDAAAVTGCNSTGTPVTEQSLSQTLPFKLTSHVALIESLIWARCMQLSPISRVVSQTKRLFSEECPEEFTTGIEEMLPYDIEDALLFWINHCLICLKKRHPNAQALQELMELFDIVEACDGLVIAAVMSLFSPQTLPVSRLSDQSSSSSVPSESLAISCVYNIQIVQLFCAVLHKNPQSLFQPQLPPALLTTLTSLSILQLELEDFLYPNKLTKSAFVLFIAELFSIFTAIFPKTAPKASLTVPPITTTLPDTVTPTNEEPDSAGRLGHSEEQGHSLNSTIKDQNTIEVPDSKFDSVSKSTESDDVPDSPQDHDRTLEGIEVEESIDLQSLSLLQRRQPEKTNENLMNSTFVQGETAAADDTPNDKDDASEKTTPLNEREGLNDSGDKSQSFVTSRSLGPLGASTPRDTHSTSADSDDRGLVSRRSLDSQASRPALQSGKDTYSVRNSQHHRPASELFVDSGVNTTDRDQDGFLRRPRSEVLDGSSSQDIRMKGFGSRAESRCSEILPPEQRAAPRNYEENAEEPFAENIRSVRAEMEMRRLQIQKQRAHEDKERLKHRQKISEAAFFKAIQPKSQDSSHAIAVGQPPQNYSMTSRNPSMSNISVQTSIETRDESEFGQNMTPQRYGENYGEYRQDARSDIHRTASLDWSKSGLGSPLDAPGVRGTQSYRGFSSRKCGSTYDMSSGDPNRMLYGGGGMGSLGGTVYGDEHSQEKAEKQILIEQNIKLAQELKYLKAQYATEIGYGADMIQPPHQMYTHPNTMSHSNAMAFAPGPPPPMAWTQNMPQPSFGGYPSSELGMHSHFGNSFNGSMGMLQQPGQFLNTATPVQGMNQQSPFQQNYERSSHQYGSSSLLASNAAFPVNTNTVRETSPFGSQSGMAVDEMSNPINTASAFQPIEHTGHIDDRLYDQTEDDAFSNDAQRLQHSFNKGSNSRRSNSYRSDVDTLETPCGVAELVNINSQFGRNQVASSPVAERKKGHLRDASPGVIHEDRLMYPVHYEENVEGVKSARVAPNGVALVIGEEGDEVKMVDYEARKKKLLKKRAEKLEADRSKLKEHERKLVMKIDSHLKQEKLIDGDAIEDGDGSKDDGRIMNNSKSSTSAAVKRPKAKVAPRVKSSTSNNDLSHPNSAGSAGNRSLSTVGDSDSNRADRSHSVMGQGSAVNTTPLKLYVKPQSRGNKQIIVNAINQCVLPGAVNAELKGKVLGEINAMDEDTKNFLLLFRDHNMKYRALYSYEPDSGLILKVSGTGPSQIKDDMIAELYKYNSGSKSFLNIPSKTMSVSVDGFTILNHLWKTNKRY